MMISQPALMWLDAIWNHLLNRQVTPAQLVRETHPEQLPMPLVPAIHVAVDGAPPPATLMAESGRDPLVIADAMQPLSVDERRARAAALKALALSRARKFDAARQAFADAARLDPDLDITRVPTFWSLERGAHEAAVSAYNDVGRTGDAAVLRARVQSTYRPKPLRRKSPAVATP